MKIDTSTPQGKAKLEELLVNAVLNEEPELLEDYEVNKVALDNYMQALQILSDWHRKGKCSFTYDLWYKPYELHCIYVQWNMENAVEGLPDYPAKEMGDLISHFDTLQLDKQEPFTWQLSSQIYFDNAETEM